MCYSVCHSLNAKGLSFHKLGSILSQLPSCHRSLEGTQVFGTAFCRSSVCDLSENWFGSCRALVLSCELAGRQRLKEPLPPLLSLPLNPFTHLLGGCADTCRCFEQGG